MRITIVQGAFLPVPPLMGGAVEKVWHRLAQEFAKSGHVVTHISRQHRGLQDQENVNGVQNLRLPGFNTPGSMVLLKALDLIYSCRVLSKLPPGDILVTNTFFLPLLVRNGKVGKLYVHVARYPKGQMRFYSRAARLQTVSKSVAEAIEKEAPEVADRVKVIPYPAIKRVGQPSSNLNGKRKILLYVGRIHPEKGLNLLLRAIMSIPRSTLDGWKVVIVGPAEVRHGGGGEKYLRELKVLAEPISDLVDWVGPVFESTLLTRMYQDASLFVYPSIADRGETFGLAPLEAITNGCVPILSDLKCFRDFIQEGTEGLYFDHRSDCPVKLLASCIASLLNNQPMLDRIAKAGIEKAGEFDVTRITKMYLADFESLAGTKHYGHNLVPQSGQRKPI